MPHAVSPDQTLVKPDLYPFPAGEMIHLPTEKELEKVHYHESGATGLILQTGFVKATSKIHSISRISLAVLTWLCKRRGKITRVLNEG